MDRLILHTVCLARQRCFRSHRETVLKLYSLFVSFTKWSRVLRCTSCMRRHHAALSSATSSYTCCTPEGHSSLTCEARHLHLQFHTLKSMPEFHAWHTVKAELWCSWFLPQRHISVVASSSQKRQFHACSTSWHHTGEKSPCGTLCQTRVCHSSAVMSKKRIPLHQTEEIDEVLAASAEIILEYAAALGCSEAEMMDMVRRDTRLVTQFAKQTVLTKMRLLLDHGFQPREIISRLVLMESVNCSYRNLRPIRRRSA